MARKNQTQISRRNLLLTAGALAVPATVGCAPEDVQKTVENLETETLENAAMALKGYVIVSFMIGPKVVTLPAPGVRVLAVFLVVSGLASKLAIEYLDVELRKRYVEEAVTEEQMKSIEADLAVNFQLKNGDVESVPLGPNQYDESDNA